MEECCICHKPVEGKEAETWYWADEPAHMKCVLNETETICHDCGALSADPSAGGDCEDCGGQMEHITEKDKTKLRKEWKVKLGSEKEKL